MLLFAGRGALLVRIACIVLLPLTLFLGAVLYFSGARWGLSILIVVTVLLCLHWPISDRISNGAGATLPVQQPAPEPAGPSHAEPVLPRGGVHGLGASAIAALPAYAYEKKAGGDDCAICLGELQLDEVVKQLPACAHLFHEVCIDAWLSSHVTCPVCRSPVDAALPASAEVVVRPQ